MKFAVIGKDVSKSVSPEIHSFISKNLGYDISYSKISVPDCFESKIAEILKDYDGLNVTIPYKLSVITHLKKTEGDAKAFGAVNTVDTATLTGYNTDGLGFMLMLKNNGVDVAGKEFLLLGAGGAGRSVAKKLTDNGAKVSVYDRNFRLASEISDGFGGVKALDKIPLTPYYAVINATGVGMHDTEGKSPVDGSVLSLCSVAIDLIYTPPKSRFLEIAESCGKKTVNGLAMLFYQAYYSECIWFNLAPDEGAAKTLFEKFSKERK